MGHTPSDQQAEVIFPIRDHNPSPRLPAMTWTLICANVAIHLVVSANYPQGAALNALYADWALIPRFISNGHGQIGLLTSQFLHVDGWHLGVNMLVLWLYGDNLEDELGPWAFALVYLAAGMAGGWAQYWAAPTSFMPVIGASGAIAGIMIAYLILFPRARLDVLVLTLVYNRIVPVYAWSVLSLWIISQVAGGLLADASQGGTAYWAHVGGALGGAALILPLWLIRGGPWFWKRRRGLPPHPPAGDLGPLRAVPIAQLQRDLGNLWRR